MEHFSPEAWTYGGFDSLLTLAQLPKGLFGQEDEQRLLARLHAHGGKALSLAVCDRLAQGSTRVKVPAWTAIPVQALMRADDQSVRPWLSQNPGPVKVRSSAWDEDWLNGRSGVEQSRTVTDPARVFEHAQEVCARRHPVVLQSFVEGIGVVVDIAYSRILCRPIVRISTGREERLADGRRLFSSATQDHEGRHEVIDPTYASFCTRPVVGTLFEDSCLKLPLQELAHELWARVQEMGITFGVQLELVVHPDRPKTWWLVQVRPSPDQVRNHGEVQEPIRSSPVLVTTPAVIGSFDMIRKAALTTDDALRWLLTAATAGIGYARASCGIYRPPEILVWHKDPPEDFQDRMLDAAFQAGALVQATCRVTAISTTHGHISDRLVRTNGDLRMGGIIALPDDIHAQVAGRLHHDTQQMHAVSDGLVGQLAFI